MTPHQLDDSPSDVAAKFFDALSAARWADAAQLVDPKSLAEFRERELASLTSWAAHRDELRAVRDQTQGVVGWSSDGKLNLDDLAKYASTPLRVPSQVRTLGELATLTPTEFVQVLFETTNAPVAPVDTDHFDRPKRKIVGTVTESDIAHVLYRQKGPAITYNDPYHVEILRLRRTNDGWRVVLTVVYQDIVSSGFFMMLEDDVSDWPQSS